MSRKTQRSDSRKRVAVLIGTDTGFSRDVLRGIVGYARRNANWVFYSSRLGGLSQIRRLGDWHGDGVIGYIDALEDLRLLSGTKLAMVDVGGRHEERAVPRVSVDDRQVGKLAAEHLLSRGLVDFAYVGRAKHYLSDYRGTMFAEGLKASPSAVFHGIFHSHNDGSQETQRRLLGKWLEKLPRPLGIMAFTDDMALNVMQAARTLRLKIPDEIAVVGVDNDDLICELADPPLSSVDSAGDHVGFEAAAMLDRMMRGETLPAKAVYINPRGVVERQSSDIRQVEDADVGEAVAFIRTHAAEGINVEDVLRQVPISRRTLERRFQETLGRSLHGEIQRQRLNHAKRLLTETQMSLADISEACSYKQAAHLTQAFRRYVGVTPSAYRSEHCRR
jgi:LacI family transcriptional regulator